MLRAKQRNRKPVFCGKCGRVTFEDSDQYKKWWLVGTGEGMTIIRCPQHITEWTLRMSGKGRSMAAYKWRREAREHDEPEPLDYTEPFYSEMDL